ncbi:hypothetical protein Lgra_3192 [Legionella gratiana]|uniref:Uncharacterized protein n=1 Tax=Legionella gratiana TaxID=45066 RepID=A0A378JC98_9GAMM|nr:hypothetical protein [Legionella gratiana]KTD06415.1 hypothetical protein Lgra_3192 [Legionella gratiana]STX45235.1 Uncharacterised protein [Legionella gratiana]
MSKSAIEMAKELSFFRDAKQLQDFTEKCLANPSLTAKQKIQLIHLNQNNRLNIIAQVQQHTFEHLFKKKPNEFFTNKYHYDWWMFPMYVPKEWGWEQRNYDSSINLLEAQSLLRNKPFIDTYIDSVALYLTALKEHGWNNYPVRYARMLHSLSLFLRAAQKEGNQSEVYERLYEQTKNAVAYAKHYVLPSNNDYELLHIGYKATVQHIKKYEEESLNDVKKCNYL